MDIKTITDSYAVSAQIDPSDMAAIAEAGFKTVICNRPDSEIPADLQSTAMALAAQAAGLEYVSNPVTRPTINAETVGAQADLIAAANGPVLAYCGSGTRSSVLWSLGRVGKDSADDILAATSRAGYDLSGLRPQLGD